MVASLVGQVAYLFEQSNAIGTSRHAAKALAKAAGRDPRGGGDKIHSWGTYNRQMDSAQQFVRWLGATFKEVRLVRDIQPTHIRAYFEARCQAVKPNTLAADLGGIRRLDKAAQQVGWTKGSFVPDDVQAKRKFSPRGAYTDAEAKAIIGKVAERDGLSAQVLAFQHSAGLRVREAIYLSPQAFFDKRRGIVRPGIDVAAGQVFVDGKGGRQRVVTVPDPTLLARLDLSKAFPLRNQYSDKSQIRRVEEQVKRACQALGIPCRGTHGLRARATRDFLAARLAAGDSLRVARRATATMLGHNRPSILKHYLIDPP